MARCCLSAVIQVFRILEIPNLFEKTIFTLRYIITYMYIQLLTHCLVFKLEKQAPIYFSGSGERCDSCCEATIMFCPLRSFTHISISMWMSG